MNATAKLWINALPIPFKLKADFDINRAGAAAPVSAWGVGRGGGCHIQNLPLGGVVSQQNERLRRVRSGDNWCLEFFTVDVNGAFSTIVLLWSQNCSFVVFT